MSPVATALAAIAVLAMPLQAQETYSFIEPGSDSRTVAPVVQLLDLPALTDLQEAPLVEGLRRLSERSGVPLAYSASLLPAERRVSCSCMDLTVGQALERILAGTGFQFVTLNEQVVIERQADPAQGAVRLASAAPMTVALSQSSVSGGSGFLAPMRVGTIVGEVVDATTGGPLFGAQVFVVGASLGSITNEEGRYTIQNVPAGEVTVGVRLIGYAESEQTVTVPDGGTAVANFRVREQALQLDEVVVTGTAGQARRREVGNSIASVDAERLELEPIGQTQDAITAQVPGMVVMANEGVAGAGGSIRIRGINSMTQGNSPLIYVDGVRIFSDDLPNSAQGQGSAPLNFINPNDIERIEVIKGAAATTLYGTEASSGVVQIFTKRGSGAGGAVWDAQITQGVSRLGQIGPEPTPQWFEVWGENSGGLFMDQHVRTGHTQEYDLSVRGSAGEGPGAVRYYLSGGWADDQGVLPKNSARTMNLRGNLGFSPIEALNIQFTSSAVMNDIVWIPGGNLAKSFTLNVMRGPFDYTADADSVFMTEFDVVESGKQFTTGVELLYTPISNLNARLNLGLDYIDTDYTRTEIFGSLLEPEGYRNARRFGNLSRTVDFQATYSKELLGISTSTSAGFQVYDSERVVVQGTSGQFAGPGNPTLNTGSQQNSFESRLKEVNAGFFVQEMLGFADRLFITGGLRVDGNSAFGSDYGLQAYPKLSASYVISDEGFWPSFLESTKLRMAYGESGKAPGYFDAERTWSPISGQEGQPGVTPRTRGNPNLGPERSRELEAGVELSALDGRVVVDGSVYNQETTDALLLVPQDPTLGYLSSQIDNVGRITNQGYEVNVTGTLIRGDEVNWDVTVGASGNRSEMADLGGSADVFVGAALSPGLWVREGYPVPGFWGPALQNPDAVGEAPVTEEEYYGPVYPTRTATLSTVLTLWNRLTATARSEYQGGHYNLSHTAWRNAQRGVWPPCLEVSQRIADGEQDQLTAAEIYECGNFSASYGAYISPADFFRLRSVGLTYGVPEGWTRGYGDWTVSLGARNLFISTDYVGLDPELNQGGETLGRHEYYQVPPPRTFTFTLRTTF